jgi:glycosyltransferase involved in cell wall biosynthesis
VLSPSVILITYQWPEALDRVLASLAAQTCPPHEIIVADDGSTGDTRRLIDRWRDNMPCPLTHVWQADEGFRAARARNRAAATATGDYLIFLDGDCIVLPEFIRRHLALAQPQRFVAGNRILLNAQLTGELLAGRQDPLTWGTLDWLVARLRRRVNRLLPLLRLGDGQWRQRRSHQWQGAKSCNLAIHARDFVAVNGFDASFEGWGHEDADLVARLIHQGVLRKDGNFAVPVLHLWHRENSRAAEKNNIERLQHTLSQRARSRALEGLAEHDDSPLADG